MKFPSTVGPYCLSALLKSLPCPKSTPLLWIVTEYQSCYCSSQLGLLISFIISLEIFIVFRCYPYPCLTLFGVMLCAVVSPLLRIVTGYRGGTLIHSPVFSVTFVIKLLVAYGLQVLSRTMLEDGVLAVSC